MFKQDIKVTKYLFSDDNTDLQAAVRITELPENTPVTAIQVADEMDYVYVESTFGQALSEEQIHKLVEKALTVAKTMNGKPPSKYGEKPATVELD